MHGQTFEPKWLIDDVDLKWLIDDVDDGDDDGDDLSKTFRNLEGFVFKTFQD